MNTYAIDSSAIKAVWGDDRQTHLMMQGGQVIYLKVPIEQICDQLTEMDMQRLNLNSSGVEEQWERMDNKIKDGGPAFPGVCYQCDKDGNDATIYGMSLRDWFAGQANGSGLCPYNQYEHEDCAAWAYLRADAMLAERDK